MDESEKQAILRDLKAGRDALGEAAAGVDDTLAQRKPSPGSWSILGCVEHTERYLLSRLKAAEDTQWTIDAPVTPP